MKVVFFDKETGIFAGWENITKEQADADPNDVYDECVNTDCKAQILNSDGSVYRLVNY